MVTYVRSIAGAIAELERQLARARTENRKRKLMWRIAERKALLPKVQP